MFARTTKILRKASGPLIGRTRRRVAISGLRNTGKTVFITSLINHLINHDAGSFSVGQDGAADIRWLGAIPVNANTDFPYEQYRRRMGREKRWPEKTRSFSQYKCRIKPSHFWSREVELELRDFPGERFADAPMYNASYEDWSKFVLRWFEDDDTYAPLSTPFREALKSQTLDEHELIQAYKRALAQLAMVYKPLISPSTFLLGQDGSQATQKPVEELVAERLVGVSGEHEFVPLTGDAIKRSGELAALFAARYAMYKEQIVVPLIKSLRQCDRLVFLVDIPAILMAGPGMLHDSRDVLKFLLATLQRGGMASICLDLLCSPLPINWQPGGIRRISFIAAKADKTVEADQDNLEHLLKDMTQDIVSPLENVDVKYVVCSAVVSASPHSESGENWLRGRLIRRNGTICDPSEPDFPYEIPRRVPEDWPDKWTAGEFVFPDVYPRFPAPEFKPPEQRGLNTALQTVLER